MLELCRQERLLRVMEERGFTLYQQNGQRTYGGPPPNWGFRSPPPRESEIFIGRLPRMCFEDELIPLFSSIGELYEFRLMLDFSGTNRGFAYAHYATEESAVNAIRVLNHYEIRPNHYIGVLRSKNNCRLLFSNIKQDTDLHAFSDCIRHLTNEVQRVSMFATFDDLKAAEIGLTLEVEESFQEKMARYAPHSKFAIVEYETHKAAAVARRVLIPKLGHMFAIDWAIPLKDRSNPDKNYDACIIPGNDFVKVRPIPVFFPRRSNLEVFLYSTTVFKNIGKYFRFILNTTLHKSMRKGDLPLAVYLEMQKKIIERVKNIEHCGQATQLILNYLSWYSEKMTLMIDPDSEKILREVKYYSDKLLLIATNALTRSNNIKSDMEEYVNNTIPIYLNFCYYIAVFLCGDERDKVCGLISNSLSWFEGIMQRVGQGNEQVTQFLTEISFLADEMEEDRKRGDFFIPVPGSRKRKPENIPGTSGWKTRFSRQSFPRLKKSATSTDQEKMETTELGLKPGPFSQRPFEVPIYQTRHGFLVGQPLSPTLQNFDASLGFPCQIPAFVLAAEGELRLNLPRLDIDLRQGQPIPVLIPQPSVTDFATYMPKQFYNVYKYFKFVLVSNLQRCVERNELTLHIYREIAANVMNNITNLETCVKALGIVMEYLAVNRDGRSVAVPDEFFKIIHDVRLYASILINYMYNRRTCGLTTSDEVEEYYCRLLPTQLSFLYHLSMLLSDDEKVDITRRLTDTLRWLNDLVKKYKAGDVDVLEFFERISRNGCHNAGVNPVPTREIIKEVYDEFNTLLGPVRVGNI